MEDKKKPHILIIDDESIDRLVLKSLLQQGNYHLSEAATGTKAMDFLWKNAKYVDVIILDRLMPDISGIDLLYKFCAIPTVRDIPVILLSAYVSEHDEKTAEQCGAFEVILKPIDKEAILTAVQRALREKRSKVYL